MTDTYLPKAIMDKITYSTAENEFLQNNFFSMTNQQLLDVINTLRPDPVCLSNMRHQCYRLGLNRGIQIRWSKSDIEFLKANYQKHGYTELAMMLNERKSTFRIINGEKVFRTFTKKHVEKKQELLGLKHTNEGSYKIRIRNNEIFSIGYTILDNGYTQGYKTIFPENEIRVWSMHGQLYKVIKIDGKFKWLNRYNYEQINGPIPDDKILICKSDDSLNCDPDNWKLVSRSESIIKFSGSKELTDKYVISRMTFFQPQLRDLIAEMPELIELKRNQLILRRKINELNQVTTND